MTSMLPSILQPIAIPASSMYRRIIARRNARFDQGVGIEHVERPVISVGNITTGGTGKSPMVRWLVQTLIEYGKHPVIVMRGYGARNGQISDEQAEHRDALPQVDVLADPDRVEALRAYLPGHPDIDCVMMDDGFQHRRLHRDLDLVLVDATRDTMNDRLIPAGHLREPLENLARADAVIVTRADTYNEALASDIERLHGRAPIAWSRHDWTGLNIFYPHKSHADQRSCEWLKGKRVVTMLGVGNPESLRAQVRAAGATIIADIPVRDHQSYDRQMLTAAADCSREADALLMTRKDWVKVAGLLDSAATRPEVIVVPELTLSMWQGEEELRRMVERTVSSVLD